MKYKLLIDPLAKRDIVDIYNYVVESDSEESADRLLNNLENSCLNLEELPFRGHVPRELKGSGLKRFLEVHYKPYRIIYEIIDSIVYVHCLLDGRRNIQEILAERLLR